MKKIYALIVACLLVLTMATPTFAANKLGAKAHGMGGAFTAVADDASAIYWNPAGLTQAGLLGLQVNLGAQVNMDDVDKVQDFLDSVDQIKGGTTEEKIDAVKDLELPDDVTLYLNGMGTANLKRLGFGMIANNEFSTQITEENDREVQSASNLFIGEGIISLGKNVIDPPLNIGSIALGVNAKLLSGQYDSVEYTFNDTSFDENEESVTATGYGVDAGALIKVTNMVNVGLNIRNLTSNLEWDDDIEGLDDRLDRTITLGAAARLPFPIAATIAGDIEVPEEGDNIYHVGLQKDIIIGLISLRVGAYQEGSDTESRIYTGGLGINIPFLKLNVAVDSDKYASLSGIFKF